VAEKISVKTLSTIFLLCAVIAAMCACVVPVDYDKFLGDERVQKIYKEKVLIHDESDGDMLPDLAGENGKITGLISGKYYRVEEYDKDKNYIRNLFLQSNGTLIGDLSKINILEGTTIEKLPDGKALTNNYYYKVKLAQPFDPGNPDDPEANYKYFNLGGSKTDTAKPTEESDGITKLALKITETKDYCLDLSYVIKSDNIYEVMQLESESWKSSRTSAHYKSYGDNVSLPTQGPFDETRYTKDLSKSIGIYQYRGKVKTGNIPLEDMSIIVLPVDNTLSNYVFVEYDKDEFNNTKKLIVTNFWVLKVELKQTPSATDFRIVGNEQPVTYDGSPKTVTITPKAGKSDGAITVYYNGIEDEPKDVGVYTVTFDVGEADGWEAVTGLSAGTITINKANPVAENFNITGIGEFDYDGNAKIVTVELQQGKTGAGAVTVKYNGSTTAPSNARSYPVTFDVAVGSNYNAASGLSAGTLTINKATPIADDFNGTGNKQFTYDGSTHGFNITPKPGKSLGTITYHYTNGIIYDSSSPPTDVGIYTVTFDVAPSADGNWIAAPGLSAGTLTINPDTSPISVHLNVTLKWLGLAANEPEFTNNSGYDSSTGELTIDIDITNYEKFSYFEWYADFTNSILASGSNKSHLLLQLDDKTSGLDWSVPGEFTITLIVDHIYKAEFSFTIIPAE